MTKTRAIKSSAEIWITRWKMQKRLGCLFGWSALCLITTSLNRWDGVWQFLSEIISILRYLRLINAIIDWIGCECLVDICGFVFLTATASQSAEPYLQKPRYRQAKRLCLQSDIFAHRFDWVAGAGCCHHTSKTRGVRFTLWSTASLYLLGAEIGLGS